MARAAGVVAVLLAQFDHAAPASRLRSGSGHLLEHRQDTASGIRACRECVRSDGRARRPVRRPRRSIPRARPRAASHSRDWFATASAIGCASVSACVFSIFSISPSCVVLDLVPERLQRLHLRQDRPVLLVVGRRVQLAAELLDPSSCSRTIRPRGSPPAPADCRNRVAPSPRAPPSVSASFRVRMPRRRSPAFSTRVRRPRSWLSTRYNDMRSSVRVISDDGSTPRRAHSRRILNVSR